MGKGFQFITKNGYDGFEIASGMQKYARRGDNKMIFCALELFPRYSNYAWKRIITISCEDLYDGELVAQIHALREGFYFCNKGKKSDDFGSRIFITKACLLILRAKKSREADHAQFCVDKQGRLELDNFVFDVHTKKGKQRGKTKKDFIIEEQEGLVNAVEDPYYDKLMEVIDEPEKSKKNPGMSDTGQGLFD